MSPIFPRCGCPRSSVPDLLPVLPLLRSSDLKAVSSIFQQCLSNTFLPLRHNNPLSTHHQKPLHPVFQSFQMHLLRKVSDLNCHRSSWSLANEALVLRKMKVYVFQDQEWYWHQLIAGSGRLHKNHLES